MQAAEEDADRFWDRLAPTYDALYQDKWSLEEDRRLSLWLEQAFFDPTYSEFLDIGCGTGLGLFLISQFKRSGEFVAVDASNEMLRQFEAKVAGKEIGFNLSLLHARASTLEKSLGGRIFDSIIMLNCAASYLGPPSFTLQLASRTLKPGGRAFLSFLNSNSLRRVLWGIRSARERFGSRGAEEIGDVEAWALTRHQAIRRAHRFGFTVLDVHFQSVLGGIWESQWSIWLERVLISVSPQIGHSLNLVLEKNC